MILVKEALQKQLTLLKSIPSMGNKTAMHLIILTDGFSNFEDARQLFSYTGITPIIHESGSCVRGKS